MIISLNEIPRFALSDNVYGLKITSNRQNILYYSVNLYISTQYVNSPTYLISNQKIYPFPTGDYKTSIVQPMPILKDFIANYFKGQTNLNSYVGVQEFQNNLLKYKLEITEYYNANNVLTMGDTTNFEAFIMKGKLDNVSEAFYSDTKHLVDPRIITQPAFYQPVYFLTKYKHDKYKQTYFQSVEYLYFLSSFGLANLDVNVEYRLNGGTIQTKKIYDYNIIYALETIYRIDVSPSKLFTSTELETLEGYKIYLTNKPVNPWPVETILTVKQSYKYNGSLPCSNEVLNVWFQNSFGVYEHLLMINNITTFRRTEVSYSSNIYDIYDTNYNALDERVEGENIFKEAHKVLSLDNKNELNCNTIQMSDDYLFWLNDLFSSKSFFIQVGLGEEDYYIPARLLSSSLDMSILRYQNAKPNTRKITFELNNDYTMYFMDYDTDTYIPPALPNSINGMVVSYTQ